MNPKDYLPSNDDFNAVASAYEIRAAKSLLKAAEIRRNKERDNIELNPKRDDENLKNDIVYKLGLIAGLNFIIDLPREAKKHIHNLEGDLK